VNIKPLADRVVIQPLEAVERTKGGIVLPDTAEKQRKEQGEVVAVGTGEDIVKLGLKPGDKVLFGKYSGAEVTVDDEQLLIIKESDVLAVVG